MSDDCMTFQASESQALLRFHASQIVIAIDNGGLRSWQLPLVLATLQRMMTLTESIQTDLSKIKGE